MYVYVADLKKEPSSRLWIPIPILRVIVSITPWETVEVNGDMMGAVGLDYYVAILAEIEVFQQIIR